MGDGTGAGVPQLLIGEVTDQYGFPPVVDLTLETPQGTKHVSVAIPDWRKLAGFDAALKAALQRDRYDSEAATARVKHITGKGFRAAIKEQGRGKTIFFGHSAGAGSGIFVDGMDKAPISEAELTRMFADAQAPRPTIHACWSGTLKIGERAGMSGPLKPIKMFGDVAVKRGMAAKAHLGWQDLVVTNITLYEEGKSEVPADGGLRQHEPMAIP